MPDRPPSSRPSKGGSDANRKSPPKRHPDGVDENGVRWMWPFELTERIGDGGMGVVYRARHAINDREVAVKMLPSDVEDAVILARFEQELEILKDLKHPNIVRCFGGVCANQRRFYAMELVPGGSLDEEIKRRGKLPWEQVVEYGEQMAAALQASHAKGIVHRDVKPGNFLKTRSGQLKLSDFGLARIDAGRKITRAGKTAGTVLYMAPEQIRGQEITPQTDLYALGCVFYELLTGRTPFTGDAAATILHAHVMQQPQRLGQLATDCPPALEELVHSLLAKEPADRPTSAAEVGGILAQLGETIHLTPRRNLSITTRPSNRPTALPNEQTQPLVDATVGTVSLPKLAALPKWALPTAATCFVLLVSALIWQTTAAASLAPWKDRWMKTASTAGPNQEFALKQIAALGPEDDAVVAVFVSVLGSSNAESRRAAAEAAIELTSRDLQLVGTLNRLAKGDPDSGVRYAAQRAARVMKRDE